MIEDLITTIVMLTPGILASKTYRVLTRQPQATTDTYKAPEILLFAVFAHGIAKAVGTGPLGTHVIGLVIGMVAAQLAFLTSQEKWRDRLIWRHIGNRSLIPTWYSSFLAGDGKWWQIERKGKRDPIVCEIVEWPSDPASGYYRIKAVSGDRDHRDGGEFLVPANTIELLEIRDDSSANSPVPPETNKRDALPPSGPSTRSIYSILVGGLVLTALLGFGRRSWRDVWPARRSS